jgi:hypothetical protein
MTLPTVEIIVDRADKLARQVYGFKYVPEFHALILETYSYMERLTRKHKWAPCQQWIRQAHDVFRGGITLERIPITPTVMDAAVRQFARTVVVLKEEPSAD